MCAFYVGRPLTGCFKARLPVSDVKKYVIERSDNVLYLMGDGDRIELIPMDSDSYEVIKNFSKESGEFCKSIYRLEQISNTIAVILYVYDSIIDLNQESKRLVIHLRQEDEDRMLTDEGLSGIKVEDIEEIVPTLSNLFIMNRSVFFQSGKRSGEYNIIGDNCWATIVMEKPGIYVVDSFHNNKRDKTSIGVNQIFGQVSFMLRFDALSEKGNDAIILPQFGTGIIFDAWEQYMSFQINKLRDQRANFIFGYSSIEISGGDVKVLLDNSISLKPLREIDFEYMPGQQFGYKPTIIPKPDELNALTDTRKNVTRFLGKIKNEESSSQTLLFDIPREGLLDIDGPGIIFLSGKTLEIEIRRRRKVLALIESGKNSSLNNILRLSNNNVKDIEVSTNISPINSFVLKQMFGTDDIHLSSSYTDAMSIALNTPDIALIQGPPGTGKTTLIKGLIARLKQDNKSVKVLLSSEQHDAMYNMIERFSDSGIMPPYVASKKFNEEESEENTFEKSVSKYQKMCLAECESILNRMGGKERVSTLAKQLMAILVRIRIQGYSKAILLETVDEMNDLIAKIGCAHKVRDDMIEIERFLGKNQTTAEKDPVTELLIRKINSQRLNIDAFMRDDGEDNYQSLQSMLLRKNLEDDLFPHEFEDKLLSRDKEIVLTVFPDYVRYVEQLKEKFEPTIDNEFTTLDVSRYVDNIRKKISSYIDRDDYTLENIVEKFQYLIEDEEVVSTIVRNYTTIVGSTCAQANKLQTWGGDDLFDYVIIDEAARANPLDIMIPLSLGKKVLLVGDHKQLPHYIESKEVQEYAKKSNGDDSRTEILTKSLFQIIYENLETAKKENRINAKRTAMIKEQHRMHPVICEFISNTFYNDELKPSDRTKLCVNDYGICDGKNIGVINVPFFAGGGDLKVDNTFRREAEADKIVSLVSEILSKNPTRELSIGIIAYYRGQVELIRDKLKDTFMEEELDRISCGTVDSYQGKEFDIVLLSGVRCNPEHDIGFIKSQPSRINVSLSRAKSLLLMICDIETYAGSSTSNFDIFPKFFDYCRRVGYYV